MLVEEVEHWWENCCQHLEAEGTTITWNTFKERFWEKYFPADMCDKKEMEILALTQGSMSVERYAAKFEELSRYYPPYQNCNNVAPNL